MMSNFVIIFVYNFITKMIVLYYRSNFKFRQILKILIEKYYKLINSKYNYY